MPNSIKLFEKLTIWSLVLGSISSLFVPVEAPVEVSAGFVLIAVLVFFGLYIGLMLLVSRQRSVIAKWIWIILHVWITIRVIIDIPTDNHSYLSAIITFVTTLMSLYGIILLFSSDSKEWFISKQREKLQRLLR
ncbi:hypothetical protein SAMN05444141_105129 [Pseudovibrio denitrificans]|uniref:Uncharacterized protein n=1 Tax=Pseudovibrio denitrificans TaxID=258256 RepID=A0A1I7C3X0_9HYPH|nr:hypothetical protein SAMN05444141_105129 [Pseudovibrio denitrificans]